MRRNPEADKCDRTRRQPVRSRGTTAGRPFL
jgi:hypothetical protein